MRSQVSPLFTFSTFKVRLPEQKKNSANGNTGRPTEAPLHHKRQRNMQTLMMTTISLATAAQIRDTIPGHSDLCTSKHFLNALYNASTPLNSHSKAEHGLKKQELVGVFPLNFV